MRSFGLLAHEVRLIFVFALCRIQNVSDQIFQVIKDMLPERGGKTLTYADVLERCVSKGFKPDRIDAVIEEYEELNVWHVNQAHTKISFV